MIAGLIHLRNFMIFYIPFYIDLSYLCQACFNNRLTLQNVDYV